MIDDLRALAIFAKVAEAGSFSAAARGLRLSTSVVSHHVKALEARHGVSLLRRSTRALSLTAEGEDLLAAAQRMVQAAEEGLDRIADRSAEPAGALRVSVPAFLANSPQERGLWNFANRYPNVAITLISNDSLVNLVADGFDLAIRLGALPDSSLHSRKIGTFERVLVASPEYLRRSPEPAVPDDLSDRAFVLLDMLPSKFVLQRNNVHVTVQAERASVVVNSVAGARSAVLAGLGMQRLPLVEVTEDLRAGRLVRVLPEWSLPILNIYAVWPESSQRSSLVRLLLEYLVHSEPAEGSAD